MPTVIINGKKHTPGSNTLKKMRKRALAEQAAAASKPKTKAAAPKAVSKATAKAPIPATRSKSKPKVASTKAPIPAKMPESVKNRRTNTYFLRSIGAYDPEGGL